MPTARSNINPSTKPVIAPRSGPPAAPADAANASSSWMMTPNGFISTNIVCCSASNAIPIGITRVSELLSTAPNIRTHWIAGASRGAV